MDSLQMQTVARQRQGRSTRRRSPRQGRQGRTGRRRSPRQGRQGRSTRGRRGGFMFDCSSSPICGGRRSPRQGRERRGGMRSIPVNSVPGHHGCSWSGGLTC